MKKTDQPILNSVLKAMIVVEIFAAICVVAVSLMYVRYFNGSIEADNTKWGTFGDFFGGTLNPMLSFLALIAVLLTIALQNNQIQLTRKEMEENK